MVAQTTRAPGPLDWLRFHLVITYQQDFHFLDSDSNNHDQIISWFHLFICSFIILFHLFLTNFNFLELFLIQWRTIIESDQKLFYTFVGRLKWSLMWWNNLPPISSARSSKLGRVLWWTCAILVFEVTKFEWYFPS